MEGLMKKTILLAATILCTHQAYALHWPNCSNADQTFRIAEEEVWGANPVTCSFKGEAIRANFVAFDKRTEVELKREDGSSPREYKRDFAVTALFRGPGNDLTQTQV